VLQGPDETADPASVNEHWAPKQLGHLQQIGDQVIAPTGLSRELAVESVRHPGTSVAATYTLQGVRERIVSLV